MISNLEKYKKDLDQLILDGEQLLMAMQKECLPEQFEEQLKKVWKDKYSSFVKELPRVSDKYQDWYSESLVLVKQLLPDRIDDFRKLYEKPKTKRKDITPENYTIEDHLNGLTVTRTSGGKKEKIVGPEAAIPRFQQQFNILKSIKKRYTSTLFDIRQLIQADLFDSELEAAKELNRREF